MSFAARRRVLRRRIQLVARRTIARQALIAAQRATLIATDWPRGKCRKLAGKIGLIEGPAEESERFKPRQNVSQLHFGDHAAENQMRVVLQGRKRARQFQARMAGLNGLLRKRQITSNEDINVGGLGTFRRALRESRV